jgi:hypothetical protein
MNSSGLFWSSPRRDIDLITTDAKLNVHNDRETISFLTEIGSAEPPSEIYVLLSTLCRLERPEKGNNESECLDEGPVVEVLALAAVRESAVDDNGQHSNRHGSECLVDIAGDGAVTIIPVILSPVTESE